MKKILLFLLFNVIITPVFAIEQSQYEPTWNNNVVPAEYAKENLQYIENNTFAFKHPYLNAYTAMTIVGLPVYCYSARKSNRINENNYWYGRKVEFENQKQLCKQIKDNDSKMQCYFNLMQYETAQNIEREKVQLSKRQFYYQQLQNTNNQNFQRYTITPVGNTIYVNKY